MPAARYYQVTEHRSLVIRASTPGEAATMAHRLLAGVGTHDDNAAVTEAPRSIDLAVTET